MDLSVLSPRPQKYWRSVGPCSCFATFLWVQGALTTCAAACSKCHPHCCPSDCRPWDVGIVVRRPGSDGHTLEYHPTSACQELRPVIESIGHWGQHWVRSKLTRDELDPGMLMWFIHRHFVKEHFPPRRIVVYIEFTDVNKRMKHWWLVLEAQEVDLCLQDPGLEVDITLMTDLLSLTQVYMGDLSLDRARSMGRIKILGPRALIQSMPNWFARSRFAEDNPLSVT